MALLGSVLDTVARGRPRLLCLEGPAGSGKSALLAAVAEDARRRGWTVLSGRAAVLETGNAFGVLRQVMDGLPSAPDGRPAPEITPVAEPGAPFEVFDSVLAHLLEATAGSPVLITIDDLPWSDPMSLRWLAYLAHRSADLPLALVLSASPEETSERHFMVDELTASCERHALHPLTPAQLAPWVADVLSTRPDDAFVAGCHRATGGNPALLAALLPALAARSVRPVRESLDAVETVGAVAVRPQVLPWIERGGSEALAVAQAAVILGDDSEPVVVAELAGLGLDEAAAAADRLIKLGILSDTLPLRYVHPLVRAVVDAGISAGSRASQRLRAAHIVRDYYTGPDRAAAHLMAVEVSGEAWALDTLRAAAESALSRGHPAEALGYLRRALAEPMPVATRAELLADLGAVEVGAGTATAESTLREALTLATDPALRLRIGVDLVRTDAAAGRPLTAALKVVEQADALVEPEHAGLVAEAEAGVFFAYAASADFEELRNRLRPRLRELAARDARVNGLAGVVDAWHEVRRGRDRAACVRLARGALKDIDPRPPWEFGLRLLAVGPLLNADEYDLTEDPAGIGGHVAHHHGTTSNAMIARYLHGRALYDRGDLGAARTELTAALEDAYVARTIGAVRLACVLADAGDLDAADQLLRRHAPEQTENRTWRTTAYVFAKAAISAARDKHEEALDGFLEAGEGMRELGIDNPALFPWRSHAARSGAVLGDTLSAKSLAADEVELARRWAAPRALSTALTASAVVTGDAEAAQEAIAVLGPVEAGLHRAKALVDLGAIQLDAGLVDQGQEHLQAGFALAQEVGAKPVSLRATRLIKRSGARPDLSRIGGVAALTAQERVAAEHAAAGATNRQIADEMVLTQRTVEQYLTSTYRKLGITGRRQLAAAIAR